MMSIFTRKTLKCAFIIYGAAIGLLGCSTLSQWGFALSNTPINAIAEIDQANIQKTIQIQGKVITTAPLIDRGAYQLSDQTGAIWVLTNQSLPNTGAEIIVRGQLQYQSIPVGREDLGEFYLVELNQSSAKDETTSPINSEIESPSPALAPPAPPTPARNTPPQEAPLLNSEDLLLPHK